MVLTSLLRRVYFFAVFCFLRVCVMMVAYIAYVWLKEEDVEVWTGTRIHTYRVLFFGLQAEVVCGTDYYTAERRKHTATSLPMNVKFLSHPMLPFHVRHNAPNPTVTTSFIVAAVPSPVDR